MLYKVEWMLISWMGWSEYLVELSEEERRDLEAYFEQEQKSVKLMGYRITPADIKSLENVIEIHKEDRHNEEELYKETDKKGA
jgi:hypothetical protein